MTIQQRLLAVAIAIVAAATLAISAPSTWSLADDVPAPVIADETNWG